MYLVRKQARRLRGLITVLSNFLHIGVAPLHRAMTSAAAAGDGDDMPKTLAGFGYAFDDDGRLRQQCGDTGMTTDQPYQFVVRADDPAYNQRRYEALGDCITEHVYSLLLDAGLQRITVPAEAAATPAAGTFVFANRPDFGTSTKLLLLINGSGAVRAGQWARSLIINQSLDHGTQLPYIRRALALGYDVLVLNTNDNRNAEGRVIAASRDPVAHACTVWQQLVAGTPARVAIVAHSYGGVVVQQLLKRFGAEGFGGRVFAVGLTDSVHSDRGGGGATGDGALLERIARNWVTSAKPLNELVRRAGGGAVGLYSAGHTKHEWTSWACIEPVFEFLEEKWRADQVNNPATGGEAVPEADEAADPATEAKADLAAAGSAPKKPRNEL